MGLDECERSVAETWADSFKVTYDSNYYAAVDDLLDVLKISRDTLNNAIEADDWNFVDSVVWDIEQAVARVTKEIK